MEFRLTGVISAVRVAGLCVAASCCHVSSFPRSRAFHAYDEAMVAHLRERVQIHKRLVALVTHLRHAIPRKHLYLLLGRRHAASLALKTSVRRTVAATVRTGLARGHIDVRGRLAVREQLGADRVYRMHLGWGNGSR